MKKRNVAILLLVLGALISAFAVVCITVPSLHNALAKSVVGTMIGVGVGLLTSGISTLAAVLQELRHPEIRHRNEIENNDERNRLIRWRAQATAGNITQWIVLALAYVNILIDGPLWLTLVTVLIFMAYTILWMTLSARYQREM